MAHITDAEFGTITIRTSPGASKIAVRLAPNGSLRVSAPRFTPKFAITSLINRSRSDIRALLNEQQTLYTHDQQIGKSHSLVIHTVPGPSSVTASGTSIIVRAPEKQQLESPALQQNIRAHIIKALRKEAKSYLPRRLSYIAREHEFTYASTKLTHASSRWGSCSSSGTISLNISLMTLPFELIDYVLVHELCHTSHMNHSTEFWSLVQQYDPEYKQHRRELKQHTPHI